MFKNPSVYGLYLAHFRRAYKNRIRLSIGDKTRVSTFLLAARIERKATAHQENTTANPNPPALYNVYIIYI